MVNAQFISLTDMLVQVTILLTHVIMASHMCNKLLAMATYKTSASFAPLFVYSEHCLYHGPTQLVILFLAISASILINMTYLTLKLLTVLQVKTYLCTVAGMMQKFLHIKGLHENI